MRLDQAACIEDLIGIARRRVPSFAFDYLDGGVGQDKGIAHMRKQIERLRLRMVPLQGVSKPDLSVTLFGKKYSMPIGVAPMGLANLIWPGTDLNLARMAQRENMPYVLSTAGSTSIEDIARTAPDVCWYQLYTPRNEELRWEMIGRAASAGMHVLAITVDTPTPSRRNRNIRNNFTLQFKMTPSVALAVALRPQWSFSTLAAGIPTPQNYGRFSLPGGSSAVQMAGQIGRQHKGDITWDDFRGVRDAWKGKLVVKGVVDPESAKELISNGADGIWVSNHGGRQLESSLAPIDALPLIRKAVGPEVPLIYDSGIRGGEDIIKACALGADMVFSGRCFGYASGAGGAAGVDKAFEILQDETARGLIQMGCPAIRDLNPDWIVRTPEGQNY